MMTKNARHLKKILAISGNVSCSIGSGPKSLLPQDNEWNQKRPTLPKQLIEVALSVSRKLKTLATSLEQLTDLPKKNLSLSSVIEETLNHCSQLQLGLTAAVLFEIKPLIDQWNFCSQKIDLVGRKSTVALSEMDIQIQSIQHTADQITLWADTTQQLLKIEQLLKPLETTSKKALATQIGRWIESQTLWFQWNELQKDQHLSLTDIDSLKNLPIVMSWHAQFKGSSFCLFMNQALTHMAGDLNHHLAETSADITAELERINGELWTQIQTQIEVVHLIAAKRDFQTAKKKYQNYQQLSLFDRVSDRFREARSAVSSAWSFVSSHSIDVQLGSLLGKTWIKPIVNSQLGQKFPAELRSSVQNLVEVSGGIAWSGYAFAANPQLFLIRNGSYYLADHSSTLRNFFPGAGPEVLSGGLTMGYSGMAAYQNQRLAQFGLTIGLPQLLISGLVLPKLRKTIDDRIKRVDPTVWKQWHAPQMSKPTDEVKELKEYFDLLNYGLCMMPYVVDQVRHLASWSVENKEELLKLSDRWSK